MLLLNLIGILLLGGALAWWSERFGSHIPRMVAMIVVLADLAYLLLNLPSTESLNLTPVANDASTWLVSYSAEWIPRFGISLTLAMDGLSLVFSFDLKT